MFSDGDDGDDVFYELSLYGFLGPTLFDYGTVRVKTAEENMTPVYRIVSNGWIITLEVEQQAR